MSRRWQYGVAHSVAAFLDLNDESFFRIIITEFLDAHSFDPGSVRRSCVHMVHPDDGRMIPFDTHHLFYRGELEREHFNFLRDERTVGLDPALEIHAK